MAWEYSPKKINLCTEVALLSTYKSKKRKKQIRIVQPEMEPNPLTLEWSTLTTIFVKDDNTPVNFGTSDNNHQWSDDEVCVRLVDKEEIEEKNSLSNLCQASLTLQRIK